MELFKINFEGIYAIEIKFLSVLKRFFDPKFFVAKKGFFAIKFKKRFNSCSKMTAQYNYQLDLCLMREVVAKEIHPTDKSNQAKLIWEQITEYVNASRIGKEDGKKVNTRQTKERAQGLLSKFKKKNSVAEKASGIVEEVTELDSLLTEWLEQIEEKKRNKDAKKESEKVKIAQGLEIVRKSMIGLKDENNNESDESSSENECHDKDKDSDYKKSDEAEEESEDSDPPALSPVGATKKRKGKEAKKNKKKSKKSRSDKIFEYLEEQNKLKKKELELQERKLCLDEKKDDSYAMMMKAFMENLKNQKEKS